MKIYRFFLWECDTCGDSPPVRMRHLWEFDPCGNATPVGISRSRNATPVGIGQSLPAHAFFWLLRLGISHAGSAHGCVLRRQHDQQSQHFV